MNLHGKICDENGQSLIFVALALTCLLGFVGLAADAGTMFYAKREVQTAADGAAIAGAAQLKYGSGVTAVAQAAAVQNGMTNGTDGATVTVTQGPLYGPHAGDVKFVEAIVTKSEPTVFMKLFNIDSMTVSARAVASDGAPATSCVYSMSPTGSDTIHLQGSFAVSVPGCQVMDNSTDANALVFTGAGGTLTAGEVGVVGGASGAIGDSTPRPITGVPPEGDPLASLPPPPYSSCSAVPGGTTWGPATANGTVCYSGNISVKNNVTMNPGTYVFTGTLDLGGNGSLTGTGVTLYIAPGATLGGGGNGNTALNLTAPTSGTYDGILIYEDRSNSNTISLNGTPIVTFTGIVYAPSAQLQISGNTNMTLTSDLIVGTLYDKGNASITINNYSEVVGGPLTAATLVE